MFRNHEGYPDPTAGRALANIAKEERKAQRARCKAALVTTGKDTDKRRVLKQGKNKNRRYQKIEVMRW